MAAVAEVKDLVSQRLVDSKQHARDDIVDVGVVALRRPIAELLDGLAVRDAFYELEPMRRQRQCASGP